MDRLAEPQFGDILEEDMVHWCDFIQVGLGPRSLNPVNIFSWVISWFFRPLSMTLNHITSVCTPLLQELPTTIAPQNVLLMPLMLREEVGGCKFPG